MVCVANAAIYFKLKVSWINIFDVVFLFWMSADADDIVDVDHWFWLSSDADDDDKSVT